MLPLRLGIDLKTGRPVLLRPDALRTHLHLVGATGAGKTNSILTLLRPLLMEPRRKCCLFLIDPMGNLSHDLLSWIASSKCPEHVRQRLVYIEPARDDVVLPFNPLQQAIGDGRYYRVARAVDLILRAWNAQDLASQPRLMQWSYKALAAMAAMGLPIAMSRYLLHPGTDEHRMLLSKIPPEIRAHWEEILKAKGNEAVKILESTRNRFDPFYEAPQARRMFGSWQGTFDIERLIRERRIVIVNVAQLGRLPKLLGSTIGSLILNEVFETAFSLAAREGRAAVDPTYVLLDEFQMFAASPDIEDALPTCRQMGLRLILSHQSFAQLERNEIDLTHMIWQARSRLMFANSFEDADIIAGELARLTFDPKTVKHMLTTRRQLVAGYRSVWLRTEGEASTHADSVVDQRTVGYGRGDSESVPRTGRGGSRGTSTSHNDSHTTGGTHSDSHSRSIGRHEAQQAIHEDFEEISSLTYVPFEEHRLAWEKIIRELKTGHAFGKFVDDPTLYHLKVDHHPIRRTSALERRLQELLQRNFEQDLFISRAEADRLEELHRRELLTPPKIEFHTGDPVEPPQPDRSDDDARDDDDPPDTQPFRRPPRNS